MSTPATFYFSFRSPYSWLAYHDLSTHHRRYLNELRWQPFWEPNEEFDRILQTKNQPFPYVPMSKAKHLYMLQDVRRQARARGLQNVWPADEHPAWEISHLPWYVAQHHGLCHEYIAQVYEARWVRGADIHDPAVIDAITQRIAPHVFAPVADILADRHIQQLAAQSLQEIWENDVFGVPYFLKGAQRFWGMDRLEAFLTTMPQPSPDEANTAVEHTKIPAAAAAHTADPGHEGGCG